MISEECLQTYLKLSCEDCHKVLKIALVKDNEILANINAVHPVLCSSSKSAWKIRHQCGGTLCDERDGKCEDGSSKK